MISHLRNSSTLSLTFVLCACATPVVTHTGEFPATDTGIPFNEMPLITAKSTRFFPKECGGIKRDLTTPWNLRQYWCDTPPSVSSVKDDSFKDQLVGSSQDGLSNTVQGLFKDYKSAMTWLTDSYQYVREQNWPEAIKTASVAIILNPWSSGAYVNRSWAYAESGLLDLAIEDSTTALKIDANNGIAYNNRGYAFELSGHITEAMDDYRAACDKKYKAACTTLTQLAKVSDPNATPTKINALLDQSYSFFQQKEWRKVEELSTKVLLLDPSNAIAYVNRAGARTELGNLMNAIADSNKAIRLNPELGIAYNNNGYAHERLGQLGYAAHYYERACSLGVPSSCLDSNRITDSLTMVPNIRAEAVGYE